MQVVSNYCVIQPFVERFNSINKMEIIKEIFNKSISGINFSIIHLLREGVFGWYLFSWPLAVNVGYFVYDQMYKSETTRTFYCESNQIKNQYLELKKLDQRDPEYPIKKVELQKRLKNWRNELNQAMISQLTYLMFFSVRNPSIYSGKSLQFSSLTRALKSLKLLTFFSGIPNQTPDFVFHFVFNFDLILKTMFVASAIKSAIAYGALWTQIPICLSIFYTVTLVNLSYQIVQKVQRLAHDGFFDLAIPRYAENGDLTLDSWELKKLSSECYTKTKHGIDKVKQYALYVRDFPKNDFVELKKDWAYFKQTHLKYFQIIQKAFKTKS